MAMLHGPGLRSELLTRPANADWQLRISVADIESDGPFSDFAGVTRWFAVVAGAGVGLRFGAENTRTRRLTVDSEALQFDGAAGPHCELLDGPTRDLNLMVRVGSAVMLRVVAHVGWAEAFRERGLFTLCAGTLHSVANSAVALAPFTLAWHLGEGACRFIPHSVAQPPGGAGWWFGWSAEVKSS